jgi:hypothetical protein
VNILNRYAGLCLILAGAISLHAQPVNVQQFQNTQAAQQLQQPVAGLLANTNAPELYPGESADVGPQRILRVNPKPQYFNVTLDSQAYFSDNANFAVGKYIQSSWVYVNTVQGSITPSDIPLGAGKLTFNLGGVNQWYNYGNHQMKSLDFIAQTMFTSARYTWKDWQFSLGFSYTRLLNQGDNYQTYQEYLPVLAAQRIFTINDKLLLVVGNQVDYHFTTVPNSIAYTNSGNTEINNRFDDITSLTASWQLTQKLILQPSYRFQYSNYRYDTAQTADRNDYLNSFGITLAYYINRNISFRTFFNYNIKRSDDALTPAYHEYNGGLGGTLSFSF